MKKTVWLVAVLTTDCCWNARPCTAVVTPADGGLVFDLDFNGSRNGTPADKSTSACTIQTVGVEACQEVDGYSVRLRGRHACVAIDLAAADRMLNAFSRDFWVSPEEAAHQEVVTAASAQSGFDDLPIMLRWRNKGGHSWGAGLSHDGGFAVCLTPHACWVRSRRHRGARQVGRR